MLFKISVNSNQRYDYVIMFQSLTLQAVYLIYMNI